MNGKREGRGWEGGRGGSEGERKGGEGGLAMYAFP